MLINKNIQIEEALWDRISQLGNESNLSVDVVVSEALELFIDQSTYPVKNK